jgi:hypothetical protein
MAAEWVAPLSALAGAAIGGGLSLIGGTLISRRQSADKRAELHQQTVENSRDLVIAETRALLTAFDEFLQILREADGISAQRAEAIAKEEREESFERAINPGRRKYSFMEDAGPWCRMRPEFDHLFDEWRERVTNALPDLQDAVSAVEIAVPARFSQHAETFVRNAESLVNSFHRPGMYKVQTADVPKFVAGRAALVREVRSWLFAGDEPSRPGQTAI